MSALDTSPPHPQSGSPSGSRTGHPSQTRRALILVVALLLVELIALGLLFKHGIDFKCRANWPTAACKAASTSMVGIYCTLGALVLLASLRPAPFRALIDQAGQTRWPLGLNLAGAALAVLPVVFLKDGSATQALIPTLICWALGLVAMLGGLALYLAPARRWQAFLSNQWQLLLPVIATGVMAPYLANLIRPLWQLETISNATFVAVTRIVEGLGYEVLTDPAQKIIGAGEFFIDIAPQCSGIEGIALVTLFVTLYLALFRRDLRFPRALLLYPIGILTSAAFNVLRIAVLLIIGLEGSPELAVGGFHSHAGWLMFTLIALGIVALAQTVPALQKAPTQAPAQGAAPAPAAAPLPLRQDPVAAAILPFAVFMLSALLAQAFSQSPSLIYPGRVLFMAGVLLLFWPVYARLPWRADPVALGAGVIVGLAWVLIPVEPGDGAAPYGALTGLALVGWFIARGIGTVLLVPIIEELFFRSYLENRLRLGQGALWSVAAAVMTAALFAALHDRWVEAFLAGLVFSWVMRRRGNVTDAILSHAAANLVVFAVAWATGQVHII